MEDTQQTCRIRVHLSEILKLWKWMELLGRTEREGEDAGLRMEPMSLKVRKQVKQSQRGEEVVEERLAPAGAAEGTHVSVRWDVGERRGDGN